MAYSALISAWLVGALGGLHCLAMCGGFMAAIAARDAAAGDGTAPLLPARVIAWQQLGYQAGRIATYMLLGAAFGFGGAAALKAADVLSMQRVLYVLANVFLLVLGIKLALDAPGVGWLQRAGARTFGAMLPVVRPLLRQPGTRGRIALGFLWGLVPCALVYSVLPLAMFAGGLWQGAAVMLAFGLGTLPNLAATGLLIGRAKPVFDRTKLRFAAAALLVTFASVGMYRVLYVPGALGTGPFCLVPW
jgi:sulfite exporter TauE/SafE